MKEVLESIQTFLSSVGFFGPIICSLLLIFEAIIPVLPLAVFITFNFWYFGIPIGFLISWIFTILGCCISYYISEKKFKSWYINKLLANKKVNKFTHIFERLSFSQLVTIIAIPFTPAFMINIVAGVTNVNFKKYFFSILIGKISLVLFWGYVGTSLIESINNPVIFLKILTLVITAYIASKIVNSKYRLD